MLGPLWAGMSSLPPGQGDVVVVGIVFAQLNVAAMLPTLRATLEEWKPDVVVRESSEFAAAIAAEEQGVPHVRVGIGLALVEEGALALASPALEDRLPGISQRIAESRYLTRLPASLDPALHPVERFRDPTGDERPNPLLDWWPGDTRPLVYVSFGSVASHFPPPPLSTAARSRRLRSCRSASC
ncbi:MAG: hypothetical protein WKF41_00825 [Gaiellaceae bacterium]